MKKVLCIGLTAVMLMSAAGLSAVQAQAEEAPGKEEAGNPD